ncbi:MAG: CvpA family protein [Erysipelotrichaceae bacterium]|nr:CvpA family protein [Erysipelotrichaceae bacterium]
MNVNQGILVVNVLVILIFGLGIYSGLRKGLVRQILNFVSIIVSFVLAYLGAPLLSKEVNFVSYDQKLFDKLKFAGFDQTANLILSFVLILIVAFLVTAIIKVIIIKIIDHTAIIGTLNRLLGGLLSIVISTFIVLNLAMLLNMPFIKNGEAIKKGSLLAPLSEISSKVTGYFINDFKVSDIKVSDFNFDNIGNYSEEYVGNWFKENNIKTVDDFTRKTGLKVDIIEKAFNTTFVEFIKKIYGQ